MWIKTMYDGWINSQHIVSICARGTVNDSMEDAPVLYHVAAITPFGNKIILTHNMSEANAELTMNEIMRRFDTMTAYFDPMIWAKEI